MAEQDAYHPASPPRDRPVSLNVTARPLALFGTLAERDGLRSEAEMSVARAITMMTRARSLVLGDRVSAIGILSSRRDGLGDHFQRYQTFKHGRIFDPVVRHGTASSKVVARTMKMDCLELGELFGAYRTRWLRLPPGDWSAYREDMLTITTMLMQNLEAELRAIRQLLLIASFHSI